MSLENIHLAIIDGNAELINMEVSATIEKGLLAGESCVRRVFQQ